MSPWMTDAQQDMIDRVLAREKAGLPLSPTEQAEHDEVMHLLRAKIALLDEKLARMEDAS